MPAFTVPSITEPTRPGSPARRHFGERDATGKATRWLWTRIPARIETATDLDFDTKEARRTLTRMAVDTCRIARLRIEGEQSVVLSAGTPDQPRCIRRGRPAAKQSRE